MLFMNTWDIDDAVARWRDHPALGPATITLRNLRDMADSNSDGWAYWPLPCRSAKQLQELSERANAQHRNGRPVLVDAEEVRKCYRPIKSFLTRHDMTIDFAAPRN